MKKVKTQDSQLLQKKLITNKKKLLCTNKITRKKTKKER